MGRNASRPTGNHKGLLRLRETAKNGIYVRTSRKGKSRPGWETCTAKEGGENKQMTVQDERYSERYVRRKASKNTTAGKRRETRTG